MLVVIGKHEWHDLNHMFKHDQRGGGRCQARSQKQVCAKGAMT